MGKNRRRYARSSFSLPAQLTFGEGKVIAAVVRDLSIVGMFVETDDPMPGGSSCLATFEIEPLKSVSTRCTVARITAQGMALEITGIENRSFEYLRDLIVRSSEDPAASDNEILENMGTLPVLF